MTAKSLHSAAQRTAAAESSSPAPLFDRLRPVLPECASVSDAGELTIGGVLVSTLAEEFGTPLHVYDEDGLRRQMRRFAQGLHDRRPGSEVLFASKSAPIVGMYQLAAEEGLSVDVAGGGELQLALAAGVPAERLYLHGNAKTDDELRMALDAGVGTIIVDNENELDRLDRLLVCPQRLLLRVIPGIDAETHASQATGGHRSKFGFPIPSLPGVLERIRNRPLMQLDGVHLHIGSQILGLEQFVQAVETIATVGSFAVYDTGAGLGVQYALDEPGPEVEQYLDAITEAAARTLPEGARLLIEPGRSVVARAGITLYRTVAVKRGKATFVAVDGGMADQLDVALTGQHYEPILAERLNEAPAESVQLVGRQCESGDLLVDGAVMPPAQVDDLVALATTGAYSYTFSNNYNGALKPAVVFVRNGRARLVTARESYAELLALHAPALAAG